ncbi:MAG TPA: TadE family protein [Vicinamibacterales bacterium]|nr:TadE family protein [Vicinamibacterales bacterium]
MDQVVRLLNRCRSEEGANLVEFALVLPLLLLVMLGIAEMGFMFQRYEVVTNAAREGARLAVLPGYDTPDGIKTVQARVTAYVSSGRVPTTGTNPSVDVQDVSIPVSGGRPPISAKRVTVTYTYTYQFLNILSAFFGSHAAVPLKAVSEMRVEAGS